MTEKILINYLVRCTPPIIFIYNLQLVQHSQPTRGYLRCSDKECRQPKTGDFWSEANFSGNHTLRVVTRLEVSNKSVPSHLTGKLAWQKPL